MPEFADIPSALLDALRDARHVFVLTGAGISAESGIPTFREAQSGLWEQYDPLELATPEAFARDPALVWRWYQWRRQLVAGAAPNAGHRALARLETLAPKLTLVTQNVDGLHQQAGSREVIEMHGNLFTTRCVANDYVFESEWAAHNQPSPPQCPRCGSLGRPGVVWFGEAIPETSLMQALVALDDCDVFFSIGTSSTVWPAAGFADRARLGRATIAEINPEPTDAECDFQVSATAASALPKLVDWLADVRETHGNV